MMWLVSLTGTNCLNNSWCEIGKKAMVSIPVSEYLHITWYRISTTENKQTNKQTKNGKRYQWEWLWSPANIKRTNKGAKICVGMSTNVHNLLFLAHTLYMSYTTKTFLLVSSSVSSKQPLCFVQGNGQCFVEFHNHFFLLTIPRWTTFLLFTFQNEIYWKAADLDVNTLNSKNNILISK